MCTIHVNEQREQTIFGENYALTQILKEYFVLSGISNLPSEDEKMLHKKVHKKVHNVTMQNRDL